MRSISVCTLICGLLVATAGRADDAEARKVIDKAIKATGGGADKTPATTWKGKGTFYGMGDGFPYIGTWSEHLPDKFRMEIENAFVMIVNGDKGWVNGEEMTKEQLTEQKEGMYAGWVLRLTPLADKAFTLVVIGDSKVDDKPAVGIKVSHKGHRDVSLYFDKETALPVKIEQTVKDDQSGKELTQESVIKEWIKAGEVKVPSKMIIKREGKLYVDGEMSDYKMSEKLPDETFSKPK